MAGAPAHVCRTGRARESGPGGVRGTLMDYDVLFRQQLGTLRQEGNYRVFAELERAAAATSPAPAATSTDQPPRSPSGARTTISAWASTRRCSPPCTRRSTAAAPAPAAPATSPAPPTTTSCSSASSPTCTARRRRCSSPRATSRTGRRSGRSGARLPGCVILSDAGNHASMIEGIRHAALREAHLEAQRPEGPRPPAGRDRPGPAEDRRLRERLLDGRRHRARSPRSSTSPRSTAR